jgi:hypothetical protein
MVLEAPQRGILIVLRDKVEVPAREQALKEAARVSGPICEHVLGQGHKGQLVSFGRADQAAVDGSLIEHEQPPRLLEVLGHDVG